MRQVFGNKLGKAKRKSAKGPSKKGRIGQRKKERLLDKNVRRKPKQRVYLQLGRDMRLDEIEHEEDAPSTHPAHQKEQPTRDKNPWIEILEAKEKERHKPEKEKVSRE